MEGASGWRVAEQAEQALKQRQAGAALHRHLLELFAHKKISAKDFAVAMHLCHESGVKGALFEPYGLSPGQPSDGHYQRHLDLVIKPHEPLYMVSTPCVARRVGHRTCMEMPTNPLHECLWSELQQDPEILIRAADTTWPSCFYANPIVAHAQREHRPLPLPIILYMDGVRYSSIIAGRADSILGVWAYNAVTFRRHLLFSLRMADCCRCGCKGWCSLFPLFQSVRWSMDAVACGQRPLLRRGGA